MTHKHTPGPWRVGFSDGSGPLCITAADQLVVRGGEHEIDYGVLNPGDRPLIAAAPELLEALKGLDEAYCRAGTPLNFAERHEDRMRLVAARTAIAKATGSAS